MSEQLQQYSVETIQSGKYDIDIVENPQKIFTDKQKDEIAKDASGILEITTGVKNRELDDIKRYLFGIEDRGRVLFLFHDNERLVGFTSLHLLNKEGEFIRYNGKTILHGGSGHILPSEQGNNLILTSVKTFLNSLPENLRPRYIEGFTQSPRLLKLMTILSGGNIYPRLDDKESQLELTELQNLLLPQIISEMGNLTIENQCVVRGMGEQVYREKILAYDEFDKFFYDKLGVDPQKGDFLHFVALIPEKIYSV